MRFQGDGRSGSGVVFEFRDRPLRPKICRSCYLMKALCLEKFGGPEVLEYRDLPEPIPASG